MTVDRRQQSTGHADRPKRAEFDVAIIGIVGLPARYGGFETLAENLVRRLSGGCRFLVVCTARDGASPEHYLGAKLEYLNWRANGWQSVVYDSLAMLKSMWRARTLLVLGVSGCLSLPLVRVLAPGTRVVTNVDGIEWKRSKWGRTARWMLRVSEAFAVQLSHQIISDNDGIQDYLEQRYAIRSTMIPYGGDSTPDDIDAQNSLRVTAFLPQRYYVCVCRVEPENNIAAILEAFAILPATQLVFVGNWQVSAYSRDLHERYSSLPNVQLLEPIYEGAKLQRLRGEAMGYVHGHSAGGTNPSLVEAMHAGLAVLAFDVEYNRYTMGGEGYYWCSSSELVTLLVTLSETQLRTESKRLQDFARRKYTWQVVCNQYARILDLPDNTLAM